MKNVGHIFILSPEARFNFIQYSDQQNAEVFQNNSYGLYANLRGKYEHLINDQPASFLTELEFSNSFKDWHSNHNREAYAKSLNIGFGELFNYFSFGDTSFKFKYKTFSGVNPLISNNTISLDADQTMFLPKQQLIIALLELNLVNNFNNTLSNTNSLMARIDYLILEIFPKYSLGFAVSATLTDTLKQKATRGTEFTFNPSVDLSHEFTDNWKLAVNYDFTQNKSKQSDYSYSKKVFSTELRYNF